LSPTDPKIATLVERETGLFQARKRELEKQLSGLADLQKLYNGEIEAVQSQFQSEKRQAELVQKELDELRGLAARGLAANPRLLLVERTIAEIEGTQRNLEAIVMRARQSIAQAAQQAEELKAKSRERIDAESDTVTAELRDTHARIDMAKQLIVEAETTAPVSAARQLRNVGVEPKYQVVRRTATSTDEMSLGSSDQIEPGDVVEVRTAPPQGPESEARVQTGRAELPVTR
jgi:chromosome segregation ATPase